MYQTQHTENEPSLLRGIDLVGRINYVVWSDVFICPHCGKELVFYDVALDEKAGKVKDTFV